jgi:hypothetical protein
MISEIESAREDLRRLFGAIEVNAAPPFDQGEPFHIVGLGGRDVPMLLFRGDALEMLRNLQRTFAASALARGGPSRKAIEEMLTKACQISAMDGHDAALDFLNTQLSEPSRRWVLAEPLQALVPADDLPLGACRLTRELPAEALPSGATDQIAAQLKGPFIVAEVEARDPESARLIAHDRIEEAVAILILASGHRGSFPRHLLSEPGERATIAGGTRVLIAPDFWESDGRVRYEYRPLSDAAAQAEDVRTDWERRALAAARWYAKATETFWPAEALTACMTALESLFVRDRRVGLKGAEVADQFTRR